MRWKPKPKPPQPKEGEWYPWFAWHPAKLSDGTWILGEDVDRRFRVVGRGRRVYDYRLPMFKWQVSPHPEVHAMEHMVTNDDEEARGALLAVARQMFREIQSGESRTITLSKLRQTDDA